MGREYRVYLTDDKILSPDLAKTADNGWLLCYWVDDGSGNSDKERRYPPHMVESYSTFPTEGENADE